MKKAILEQLVLPLGSPPQRGVPPREWFWPGVISSAMISKAEHGMEILTPQAQLVVVEEEEGYFSVS